MSQVIFDELSDATLLQVDSKKYGKYLAHIDSEDANKVASYQWHVQIDRNQQVYFSTNVKRQDGKYTTLQLHKLLKVCPDGLEVDHKSSEYMDLRKDSLRCVNNAQNAMNQRKRKGTVSQFKGVSWRKDASKWHAAIRLNSKPTHLGYFDGTPEGELEAARAYDAKASELFGEYAALNFPLEEKAA